MARNDEALEQHFGPLSDESPVVDDSMTAAEVAAYRHLLGLTTQQLADRLGNNERAIRWRESGERGVPPGVVAEMRALVAEHMTLARQMAEGGRPVSIPRSGPDRGWHLAAAAQALLLEPDVVLEWEQ